MKILIQCNHLLGNIVPGFHLDATLTPITHLNINAGQVHSLIEDMVYSGQSCSCHERDQRNIRQVILILSLICVNWMLILLLQPLGLSFSSTHSLPVWACLLRLEMFDCPLALG